MPKRRISPPGRDQILKQLLPLAKPGALLIARVEHDDDCEIWTTLSADDCSCTPDVFVEQAVAPKPQEGQS